MRVTSLQRTPWNNHISEYFHHFVSCIQLHSVSLHWSAFSHFAFCISVLWGSSITVSAGTPPAECRTACARYAVRYPPALPQEVRSAGGASLPVTVAMRHFTSRRLGRHGRTDIR